MEVHAVFSGGIWKGRSLTSPGHSRAWSVVQADRGVAVGNGPLSDSRSAGSWACSPFSHPGDREPSCPFPFGFLLFYFLHFSRRILCSCPMRTEGSHFVVFGEKNVFKSLILFRSGGWHECAMRVGFHSWTRSPWGSSSFRPVAHN